MPLECKGRARPYSDRHLTLIDPTLRTTLRKLAAGDAPWPLYLWGKPGTGKTSAACVLLDYAGPKKISGTRSKEIEDWHSGLIEVREIAGIKIAANKRELTWYKDGVAGDWTWEMLLGWVEKAEVVVFDEIGVGRESGDFKLDTMLEVLDRRCMNPIRPFIATGNLNPNEITKVYDARVASRLLSGTIFELVANDQRKAVPKPKLYAAGGAT